MKLLFENWRQYTKTLLTEVSFEDAKKNFDSKKTLKIIKNYVYEKNLAAGPKQYDNYLFTFKDWILSLIPEDLTDNQKGLSVLWLIKVARENPSFAAHLISGAHPRGALLGVLVRSRLETFFHHQRFMPQQDLMQLKTVEDLRKMADDAKEEIEKNRLSKLKSPDLIAEGTTFLRGGWSKDEELETVGEGGWVIMEIHNKAASCFHGTKDWCTAAPGLDYFDDYYEPDDPLFIFENKKTGEKFQFHYGSDQFMDEEDYPVTDRQRTLLHNLLVQTEAPQKYKVISYFEKMKIASESENPQELLALAQEPDTPMQLRFKVVNNPNTTSEALNILASSSEPEIRQNLAHHWNVTAEILDKMIDTGEDSVSVQAVIAMNKKTSAETLIKIFDQIPDISVSDDDIQHLIKTIAENKNMPFDMLMKIISESQADAATHALIKVINANPRAMASRWAVPTNRRDLIQGRFSDEELEEALRMAAKHKSPTVRIHVAKREFTPPDILLDLAKDEHKHVRQNVAGNRKAPLEAIEILANDSDSFWVRGEIAQRPQKFGPSASEATQVPLEILKKLARDVNDHVKKRAIDSLRQLEYEEEVAAAAAGTGLKENKGSRVVTFDFDDTLSLSHWDEEKEVFVHDGPHNLFIEKLKEHKQAGDTVYIVTSRNERFEERALQNPAQKSILEFVDEYQLPVDGIYFTNGKSKIETLLNLQSSIHHDDDLEDINDAEANGIKAIISDPYDNIKILKESIRAYLKKHKYMEPDGLQEGAFYVSIDKVLPTEELGHGKDHDCPSEDCERAIQDKMMAIEQGNFKPIEVCNQKPVVTARLSGVEDYTPAPKSGQDEPFFYVLNGHHRLEAAKRLGLSKIPAIQVQKEQTEPFQKAIKKKHRKMKIRLIGTGGNNYNVGGKMKKPSYKRSKSAPAGFGGSLEEDK